MKNTILNYLDSEIERHRKTTGDYPKKLELSQSSFEKMREEVKNQINEQCWYHFKEPNYRGILIEIKGV